MKPFVVPGNPIAKGRPRVMKGGWTFTPKRTLDHEAKIVSYALAAKARPMSGPLEVEIWFWMESRRRVDVDNLAKCVLDALNGILWDDDDQVVDLVLHKRYSKEGPHTHISCGQAKKFS